MTKKILFLEDEMLLSEVIKEMLEPDFEVVLAESCKAAKEILKTQSFDLLFSDVHLPDGKGVDLAKWMTENSINTPVVYGSGNDHTEFIKSFGPISLDNFIEKPYHVRELRDKFNKLIG